MLQRHLNSFVADRRATAPDNRDIDQKNWNSDFPSTLPLLRTITLSGGPMRVFWTDNTWIFKVDTTFYNDGHPHFPSRLDIPLSRTTDEWSSLCVQALHWCGRTDGLSITPGQTGHRSDLQLVRRAFPLTTQLENGHAESHSACSACSFRTLLCLRQVPLLLGYSKVRLLSRRFGLTWQSAYSLTWQWTNPLEAKWLLIDILEAESDLSTHSLEVLQYHISPWHGGYPRRSSNISWRDYF